MAQEQWLNEGDKHFNAGRYQQALAAYEQAIQLNPNHSPSYQRKGLALEGLQRYVEAVDVYKRAIQLDPNAADAYGRMGWTLLQLGCAEGVEALAQADRLDPSGNRMKELDRILAQTKESAQKYWVMRREASDAGPGGYYRRQQKYAGPFATKAEAWTKAQGLNDAQRSTISDERLDKATRRALSEARVNYWPMSEDEMKEARRNGTSIY